MNVRYQALLEVGDRAIDEIIGHLSLESLENAFPKIAQEPAGLAELNAARVQMQKFYKSKARAAMIKIYEQEHVPETLEALQAVIDDKDKRGSKAEQVHEISSELRARQALEEEHLKKRLEEEKAQGKAVLNELRDQKRDLEQMLESIASCFTGIQSALDEFDASPLANKNVQDLNYLLKHDHV